MTDDPHSDNFKLLSLCAILRWFDRDLLLALTGCDEGDLAALLASDLLVPVVGTTDAYKLQEHVRADVLARLRAEQSFGELEQHTRAFEYFLRQMEQSEPTDTRLSYEENCLYHLNELFSLLKQRLEWHTILENTAAVRAAGIQQTHHLHRLSLYEGYSFVNTQDYDRGRAILIILLDQPALESDLRMQALSGLAQAEWYQTHYDRALIWYQQLYAFAHETENRVYQALALLNMGGIYNELGYYDQALEFCMQSLPIFREQREYIREAYTLRQIGVNAMYLGRWQIAQEHFDHAIRLFKSLRITAGLIVLYWGEGFLYHMLGDESRSEAAYLHALPLSRSPEYGQPSMALEVLSDLGFLYQTQGRWDAALSNYEQAMELAISLRREHLVSLIHYRRGNVFQHQGRLDEALEAYRQAINTIEPLRGATKGEEIKIGLLATTQQIYESMILLCLEQDRALEAFEYMERARSRAFLDLLADKSPELYDAFAQPVATLAEVQATLPAGALLLEYYTTGVLPRGESLINQLPPENTRLREHLVLPPHTLIFAVTRDRFEVHRAPLDPNMLRPQQGDPNPGRRLLRERLLAQLYESLLAPIAPLLRGRELLYLIPHGPLHYVPFLALRPFAGPPLLQAGGPAVALAPSATVLLRNCLGRPPSSAVGMLALGYNDPEGDPLRYAEAEARHIARLLGGAALTGPAPKRDALIAQGRGARWLHFAGHAIYHPRDPLASELRLGAGEVFSARALIGELDLDADLVTLSACTSGVSQVVAGDELLGLQRAFLYAGARAVLCTLWEAADFVALLLMDRFYAGLRRGQPPAAALRDAQIAVRDMTGRDLVAALDRWRADDPEFIAALGELPNITPDLLDTPLYADPLWWAPFMLFGRAD